MKPSFKETVQAIVPTIPPGKVATYGDVAKLAGSPKATVAAGQALGAPDDVDGWHRVVDAKGRLTSPAIERQRRLLEDEDVMVTKPKVHYFVNLAEHRWTPSAD